MVDLKNAGSATGVSLSDSIRDTTELVNGDETARVSTSVVRRRSWVPGLPKLSRMLATGKSQIETARILRVSRATIQRAYPGSGGRR